MHSCGSATQHSPRGVPVTTTTRRLPAKLILPLVLALSATPSRLHAQDLMDAKAAAYLREQSSPALDAVHVKILALANPIPADKFSWRPSAGVRSVSEV